MLHYLRNALFNQRPQSEYLDLTQHEIEALKYKYNLADAHTHQSQSAAQRRIIERLPKLWYESERTPQHILEKRFLENFFRVQKQDHALKTDTAMLVYAASIAMVITANYLMKRGMTISLIEPCFDNIHDILKHMQIKMYPLSESILHEPETMYANLKKHAVGDAIFIVDPNNPTGNTLFHHKKAAYRELIRFAKDHKKLLIFDYCFASFMLPTVGLEVFDVYKMLEESGVSYIAIEDTGKTWPVQDTKVAIIKTSRDIYADIYNIHTSYLLNVSPFILNLLSQYMLDSEKDSFKSVSVLLDRNREIAKKEFAGSILEYQEPMCTVSVAWFKINHPTLTATELQKWLFTEGVYILPGTYFFWSNRNRGERFIRLALARNTTIFRPAIKIIRKALKRLANQ